MIARAVSRHVSFTRLLDRLPEKSGQFGVRPRCSAESPPARPKEIIKGRKRREEYRKHDDVQPWRRILNNRGDDYGYREMDDIGREHQEEPDAVNCDNAHTCQCKG